MELCGACCIGVQILVAESILLLVTVLLGGAPLPTATVPPSKNSLRLHSPETLRVLAAFRNLGAAQVVLIGFYLASEWVAVGAAPLLLAGYGVALATLAGVSLQLSRRVRTEDKAAPVPALSESAAGAKSEGAEPASAEPQQVRSCVHTCPSACSLAIPRND